MSNPSLMSASDAACVLGVSRKTVLRWVEAGRLPAERLGDNPKAAWVLDRKSVEKLAAVLRSERIAELERLNAAAAS